jgi:glycosyltransferase involved in cell wall biosynthesis
VKVCFLSTIPIQTSRLITRQCDAVARVGARVTLIAPLHARLHNTNFKVQHFPCAAGAIGRLFSTPLALVVSLLEKADIYHIHSFQLVGCAILLKLCFRKHIVYDMFEDFPSMMLMKHTIPSPIRTICSCVVMSLERLACKTLDAIVTADPAVLRMHTIKHKLIGKARRRVFYNFPAEWFFACYESERRRLPKKYDLVYSGGMSERTGLSVLLDAVEVMAKVGVRPKVLMFGYVDGSRFVAEFKTKASEKGLRDCFEILGRVRPLEVPSLLCQARIGVVPLQPIPKFLKNIPTKMFEYWACGLPVVASNLPPIRLFLREGEFGHLVDPTDASAFAGTLLNLLSDPLGAEAMGAKAQKAVRLRMNAESEQRRLLRLYSTILGRDASDNFSM